ncbi:MAG: putative 7-carboxy-7-deazaguanine synthase QueE [Lachnospiraceae bacterium]|nr:putative 7-carboxy-7-deazaguanine synthase QueE [Lachnospiraceae bacterium]
MGRYKVVEKFVSINGEARRAGELACFIRFAGCNLNCSYCDTRWANEKNAPYEILSEEEIYEFIKSSNVKNVTLTGGEPLLQENIKRLITLLSKDKELNIEIETNGAVDISDFIDIGENVTFTVDYKLPASGMEEKMCLSNYELLRDIDTVKFVVSDKNDLDKTYKIINKYNLDKRLQVYISASFGKISNEDIVKYMLEHNMNSVRIQLQLHKYIWNPDKKGV